MENKLTVIEKIPMSEVMSISKAFAESGMFSDIKSQAQAMVKICAGQEIGLPPFASMTGIHIIQGKPTIGAGLIASRVKGSGKYDYRVTENTDKVCTIEFYQGKDKIGTCTFTIEDAKKAGTKNLDKFPKNMLFARCISNGVKWYCPDVFSGPVYVPEEMEVPITVNAVAEVVTPEPNKLTLSEACAILKAAKTLDELKANWKLIGAELQKHPSCVDEKNARKKELSEPITEILP